MEFNLVPAEDDTEREAIPVPSEKTVDLATDIRHILGDEIRRLGFPLLIEVLRTGSSVADGTAVALVGDRSRSAILLISPMDFPAVVAEDQRKAAAMRAHLGENLGSVISTPLAQGYLAGRSYALMPRQRQLSNNRVLWRMQRSIVARRVLAWLHAVTARSSSDDGAFARFARNLEHLSSLRTLDSRVRGAAEIALGRLTQRRFTPRLVPAHNDLWKGNVLRSARWSTSKGSRHGFFVIDWRGARVDGIGIYDLVHVASTFALSPRAFRGELERNVECLGCDPIDARSHLLAALGELALNLDQFSPERFQRLAKTDLALLESVGL